MTILAKWCCELLTFNRALVEMLVRDTQDIRTLPVLHNVAQWVLSALPSWSDQLHRRLLLTSIGCYVHQQCGQKYSVESAYERGRPDRPGSNAFIPAGRGARQRARQECVWGGGQQALPFLYHSIVKYRWRRLIAM